MVLAAFLRGVMPVVNILIGFCFLLICLIFWKMYLDNKLRTKKLLTDLELSVLEKEKIEILLKGIAAKR